MKLFAFVDLHGNLSALRHIVERAGKSDIDFVVNAGDLTVFGDKLNFIANELAKTKKLIIMIPYNHETDEEILKICQRHPNFVYLQRRWLRKGNYLFMGYGGGGFGFTDKRFDKVSEKFKKLIKKDDRVILVSHAPPYGTKTDKIGREHCGNKSIRHFVEHQKPDLVICGHLHECAGKEDRIGKTRIVNPGPKGMILEI
jgi:hypothetical protein